MNKDLTVGDPQKVLWTFCLPLFASIIFQQLYNIADSLVVGKFVSENALAAVGNSYEITLIFLAFAFGCNIACSVITSRYFGSKDYSGMKTAVSTSLIASAIMCLVLMLIGIFFCNGLLNIINTPLEVFADSKTYLDIYIWGLPFVFFYNLATGIFSALGDSKTPFIFLAISSVSNVGVDMLFVIVFNMGVAGVAWATFICQGISCVLVLFFIYRRISAIESGVRSVFFSTKMLKQFIMIAIPSTLQQCFISVGNILIQGMINSFGAGVMAGYSAGVKLNNLVITSINTLGNGVSNYASQNYGANNMPRISQGYKAARKLVFLICIPICILYVFCGNGLLGFFLENPSQTALYSGSMYLRIIAPFYFIVSIKIVSDGILRGVSMMKCFVISTFTDLLLRVVLAYLFSRTSLGFIGIWCAWPVGWTTATFISLAFLKKYLWDKVRS